MQGILHSNMLRSNIYKPKKKKKKAVPVDNNDPIKCRFLDCDLAQQISKTGEYKIKHVSKLISASRV